MMQRSDDGTLGARTMRRVTLRIVPFVMLCYFFNLLDRSNIGVASLQMRPQLGLSGAAYGLGGSLFFVGYFLFEVPSNMLMQKYGARRWLARIMISWGLMCVLMASIRGPLSFHGLRFLLGAAEAGFYPGIILYSTFWFPARYRARIIAAFSISIPLASFIGSPVSAALLGADGTLGLHGWQWIFVAEGIPTMVLGVLCLRFLTDRPATAGWLREDERAWLESTMAAERARVSTVGPMSLAVLARNPHVWALAVACSASSAASSSLSVWQPQLLKGFGLTNFETGLVNSIPYGLAAAFGVFWGVHSDRRNERRWHSALPLLLIAGGFTGVYYAAASLTVTMLLLSVILISYASFKGPFWAFSTGILSPGVAAAGLAGINAVSNLVGGGMVSLVGAVQDATGSFGLALLPIVALSLAGALLVAVLGEAQAERHPAAIDAKA